MFIDKSRDRVFALTPEAVDVIAAMLTELSESLDQDDRYSQSRLSALNQVIGHGSGKAVRVVSEPGGSLNVAEYTHLDDERCVYVFGVIRHRDGAYGVHS